MFSTKVNFNLIYKTLDSGKKWLVDFNAGKTQLVLFDRFNKCCVDVKIDGSVLDKNHLLKCWGRPSFLNWIGGLLHDLYC